MGRTLDFVAQHDAKILKGDPAFSVRCGQKLVDAEPELAGPRPRGKQRRRRYCRGKPGVATSRTTRPEVL
jgi:hypothetical protein